MWGCGGISQTCVDQAVLYYWHCLWTSKISWRMGLFKEQDVGVLPSGILMHISGHIPAVDVIE